VTGGHLRFTDEGGKVTEVYSKSGEARWFPPFKHKVENVGDEPYNAVYVGLKGKGMQLGRNSEAGSLVSQEELAKIMTENGVAKP